MFLNNIYLFISVSFYCLYFYYVETTMVLSKDSIKSWMQSYRNPESPKTKVERLDYMPKLMVFEPDRVFWPFHVETEVVPPFGVRRGQPTKKAEEAKKTMSPVNCGGRELEDRNGTLLRMYTQTPVIIKKLLRRGVNISVAETSPAIATIRHVLHLFDLDDNFIHMEIDPESPVNHVRLMKNESGLHYKDIVYFGSNTTALNEIKKELKVLTVYVAPDKGIDIKHIYAAVYLYNIRPYVKMVNGQPQFVAGQTSQTNKQAQTVSRYKAASIPQRRAFFKTTPYTKYFNKFTRKYYQKKTNYGSGKRYYNSKSE